MKNIWLINQFANTPDLPGHTRQYEIASYLVSRNWNINVFASDFNLSLRYFCKLKKIQLSKYENLNGIHWNWLRVTPYKTNNWKRKLNILSFSIHLFFRLFTLGLISVFKNNKPNIILASSPQLPATFCCLIISKIFKIPFIVEIRDLWPQVLIDMGGMEEKQILIKILRWMEKMIYKHAEYVILLSKGSIDYVKKRGAKNTIWLPNGPNLENFPEQFFEKNEPSNLQTFKVLYSGAHGKANGLQYLIHCAKILAKENIYFTLIGDGPSKNNLKELAKGLNNIEFLDPIPKSEIPNFLLSFDAVLVLLKKVPLFEYGISPNKLYDAYASYKPIIANIPGQINSEIEANHLGITAKPEDPLSLAIAIMKLKDTHPNERKNMGYRARELVENFYSRERISKKYLSVLESVISNNNIKKVNK